MTIIVVLKLMTMAHDYQVTLRDLDHPNHKYTVLIRNSTPQAAIVQALKVVRLDGIRCTYYSIKHCLKPQDYET